jgi:hypothetical protein
LPSRELSRNACIRSSTANDCSALHRCGLPDRIANGNLPTDQRKLTRWFNPAAFAAPPAGRYGNSGVNVLEGPGLNTQHVNLVKNFKITERIKRELCTEDADSLRKNEEARETVKKSADDILKDVSALLG